MIVTGTNTVVNFFVADSDGLPATGKASSITAKISIDGDDATAITDTISEFNNLPGWYKFKHTFNTAGNVFITFTCTGCKIMPWEDNVINIAASSAPTAAEVASAVWSDTATYSGGYGSQPKGYYQVNPPILNPWTTVAIPANNITYGDLVKSTANNAATIIIDMRSLATASNVSTAQSAIIEALPTIPNDYAKTTDIPDISGLATSANVTAAQDAIINAIPSVPSDYAKPGDAMTLTSAYNAAKTAASTAEITAQTSVLMSVLQEMLAGLFNWGLSHDVLTIYKDGAATKTFQITRDGQGNITGIAPIDDSSSSGGDE